MQGISLPDPALTLRLSGLEIVFLVDSLRNGDTVKGREDELGVLRPLLLLLASAYREVVKPSGVINNVIELQVTEEMTWLMRSQVRTGDLALDGTKIGINLSLSLYELLLRFNSGLELEVTAEDEGPMSQEAKDKLKEASNASRSDPGTYGSADYSS